MAGKAQNFTQRQHMLRPGYEIFRYCDSELGEVSLHHHDFYEIYLFLNGSVEYSIESRIYRLLPGDILLIGPMELHQPRIAKDHGPYERMVLWLDKRYLEQHADALLRFHRARPHQSAAPAACPAGGEPDADGTPRGGE